MRSLLRRLTSGSSARGSSAAASEHRAASATAAVLRARAIEGGFAVGRVSAVGSRARWRSSLKPAFAAPQPADGRRRLGQLHLPLARIDRSSRPNALVAGELFSDRARDAPAVFRPESRVRSRRLLGRACTGVAEAGRTAPDTFFKGGGYRDVASAHGGSGSVHL
jgi:hypothetical protein